MFENFHNKIKAYKTFTENLLYVRIVPGDGDFNSKPETKIFL